MKRLSVINIGYFELNTRTDHLPATSRNYVPLYYYHFYRHVKERTHVTIAVQGEQDYYKLVVSDQLDQFDFVCMFNLPLRGSTVALNLQTHDGLGANPGVDKFCLVLRVSHLK